MSWSHLFLTEDARTPGLFSFQCQLPRLTFTLQAVDTAFVRQILDFVAETRADPRYRDAPLGGGLYRHYSPTKALDLSACFRDASFTIVKLGEGDASYALHFGHEPGLQIQVELHDAGLDAFLDQLRDLADEVA